MTFRQKLSDSYCYQSNRSTVWYKWTFNMHKVVIKILQGSVVTQTVLGGLTIYPPVANFLQFTCAKTCENWLRADKVIAVKTVCSFFHPPCMCVCAFRCGGSGFVRLLVPVRPVHFLLHPHHEPLCTADRHVGGYCLYGQSHSRQNDARCWSDEQQQQQEQWGEFDRRNTYRMADELFWRRNPTVAITLYRQFNCW